MISRSLLASIAIAPALTLALALAGLLAPVTALGQDPARMRNLEAAFDAADAGSLDLAGATRYARDPLYPWLQAAVVRKQLRTADPVTVHPLLQSLGDTAPGRWLRPAWLSELARREDWAAFEADWRGSDDAGLRCADLRARMQSGADEPAAWRADASAIWLTGKSLPDACNPVLARLAAIGALGPDLRWKRIRLAIDEGEPGILRVAANGLPADQGDLARAYADYLQAPGESVPAGWLGTERGRLVVATSLSKLSRRDPDRALGLFQSLPAPGLDATQRAKVAYQIALWTVASYAPGAAERLAAVPESAYDDKLREWQVRDAMIRGDDAAALAAIGKMSAAQRQDSHWQYYEARLRERLGQGAAARTLYAMAARSPSFHGWLAADRLKAPYQLCPIEPRSDAALRNRVASSPGLARAFDLFAIGRIDPATREWSEATKPMDDDTRRIAVQRAIAGGWFDRAVFGLGMAPDDSRLYSLRFPLHHAEAIRRYSAGQSLDPAWVAGQTRSESSFMPRARSGADARGLMQLLPGTGALAAKRLGIPFAGGESLYDPETNLQLGTAYLRQMLDRFDGRAYLAIAAYNAGPAPVGRWRDARGSLDPDFFIETIPYKETREYVARVLAFSVVYDWRLGSQAAPLTGRMLGGLAGNDGRRAFRCDTSAP
ncbi:transglycosylase SLT domain-containing protein [soil metagenome]